MFVVNGYVEIPRKRHRRIVVIVGCAHCECGVLSKRLGGRVKAGIPVRKRRQNNLVGPVAGPRLVRAQIEEGTLLLGERPVHGLDYQPVYQEPAVVFAAPSPVDAEIVVLCVTVEHKFMASVIIGAAVNHRADVFQVVLYKGYPFFIRIAVAGSLVCLLVVFEMLLETQKEVLVEGPGAGIVIISHHAGLADVDHQSRDGGTLGLGIVCAIHKEHIRPVITPSKSKCRNGYGLLRIVTGVGVSFRGSHACIRPFEVPGYNGSGSGDAASNRRYGVAGFVPAYHRALIVVWGILVPFRGCILNLNFPILATVIHRLAHNGSRFCFSAADHAYLAGTAFHPPFDVGGSILQGERTGGGVSQNGLDAVFTRHDNPSASVEVEYIICRRRCSRSLQRHTFFTYSLRGDLALHAQSGLGRALQEFLRQCLRSTLAYRGRRCRKAEQHRHDCYK